MTTTEPRFGWPLPEDTDPLADGAAAIRTLGGGVSNTLGGVGRTVGRVVFLTFNAQGTAVYNHGEGVTPTAVSLNYVSGASVLLQFTIQTVSSVAISIAAWRVDTGGGRWTGGQAQLHIIATYPGSIVSAAAGTTRPAPLPELADPDPQA